MGWVYVARKWWWLITYDTDDLESTWFLAMERYNCCAQPFSPSTSIWQWLLLSWEFPCSSFLGQGNTLQASWTSLLAGISLSIFLPPLLPIFLPPLLPILTPMAATAGAGLKHQVSRELGRWWWFLCVCVLQLAASLPHSLKLFFPHPGKGEAELNSWHRQGEWQSHMLTQSIKDWGRPILCCHRDALVPEKCFLFLFLVFFWSVKVWSVKLWEWAGDSRIGWKLAAPKQNVEPDWSTCWIFAATEMQTIYLLFIMQLSQSSQHLWHGRAVHLHQDLQKVSAMRNYLLLTLNRVLACSAGKSPSQTKLVTIQLAKTATGKSLLETFPSSPVSSLGNHTCHFLPAFL